MQWRNLKIGESIVIGADSTEEIHNKIIDFIWNNPNPKDEQVHALVDTLGLNPHDFEQNIYEVLTSLIHLKGSEVPDDKFDPKQLEKGIEVEQEHHDHPLIRKNVAKAHLLESPDYYIPYLEDMEKEMKTAHGSSTHRLEHTWTCKNDKDYSITNIDGTDGFHIMKGPKWIAPYKSLISAKQYLAKLLKLKYDDLDFTHTTKNV